MTNFEKVGDFQKRIADLVANPETTVDELRALWLEIELEGDNPKGEFPIEWGRTLTEEGKRDSLRRDRDDARVALRTLAELVNNIADRTETAAGVIGS